MQTKLAKAKNITAMSEEPEVKMRAAIGGSAAEVIKVRGDTATTTMTNNTTTNIPPALKNLATSESSEQVDRQNLAEVHKRIRQEKQQSGKVITVAEAKKLIEAEKTATKTTRTAGGSKAGVATGLKKNDSRRVIAGGSSPPELKSTLDRKNSKSNLTPSKMIPLNSIRKSQKAHGVPHKTPSVINLTAEKTKERSPSISKAPAIPASLTFDDI